MGIEEKAIDIYKKLYTRETDWFSACGDFMFYFEKDGWNWRYTGKKALFANIPSFKTSGFKTRKDAAKYLDLILDSNIIKNGFNRGDLVIYRCKGYNFLVCKDEKSWSIYNGKYSFMTNQKGKIYNAYTRLEAIKYMLEKHPEFAEPTADTPKTNDK